MNKRPIEQARDADLRHSATALQRAAQQARDLARKTGTTLVFSRDGQLEYRKPEEFVSNLAACEPSKS